MKVTVEADVAAPIETAWTAWTTAGDIMQWNAASADWACPAAALELRDGGAFRYRMEARDGSMGFDFEGVFDRVVAPVLIEATFGDRALRIDFIADGDRTIVRETFDAEAENPVDMQRAGWQAILDNYKRHVEAGR